MNILVTGANGFIGNCVVSELLRRNHHVSVIVRSENKITFDKEKVNLYKGDFTSFSDLKTAAKNCEVIIHAAAMTAMNFLRLEDYEKVNAQGTENVLKAAQELGIKRIIYVSTSNTIGYGNKESSANETTPMQFPFTESFYAKSKKAGEDILLNQNQIEVIIINPCFVAGYSLFDLSSVRLIKYGIGKFFLLIPKGGKNFVALPKVVDAICNSVLNGKHGGKYLICGENLTYKDFFKLLAKIGNYNQIQIEIPDVLMNLAGYAGDILRKLSVKTEVCSNNIRQLLVRENYTGVKAEKELHISTFELKTALKEFFRDVKQISCDE